MRVRVAVSMVTLQTLRPLRITTIPPAISAAYVFVLSDERTLHLHTMQFICLFYKYTPLSSSLTLSFPEIILTPISIKENIKITFSITS